MESQENIVDTAVAGLLCQGKSFYAGILAQMERRPNNKIPTLQTIFLKNKLIMEYNEEYLKPLSLAEVMERLEHEILHVITLCDKRGINKKWTNWILSSDLAINQMLDKDLLKDGCHVGSKEFPYPPNLSAERYYEILEKESKTQNSGGCGRTIQEISEMAESLIKKAVETQKMMGNVPGNLKELVDDIFFKNKIDWKHILRQSISSAVKSGTRYSWKKESRRLGEKHKGTLKQRIVKVVVGIDTSGSIGTEEFQSFISEIKSIQKCYKNKFVIIEADTCIQKEYTLDRFKKVDTEFKGRGGTDFRPIFKRAVELKTNLFIFFTDTCGTMPESRPNFQTIWCVLSGPNNVPFGKELIIENEKND